MKICKLILSIVLAGQCGCTASRASSGTFTGEGGDKRVANLRVAKRYPWIDQGACVVRNASRDWQELARACFSQLDQHLVRFRDTRKACAVSDADAATVQQVVGLCLFMQPELVVAGVIIVGLVYAAPLIVEEIGRIEQIVEMSKGGSQNKENEYVRAARQEPDPCAWLDQQYDSTTNNQERLKIVLAQKVLGCRNKQKRGR
jgi:hypothetical protein